MKRPKNFSNNLKEICKIAHQNKIIVIGDGVSYAPHGFPNVKDLDELKRRKEINALLVNSLQTQASKSD